MFTNHMNLIYMNKPDLALNNQQWLICRKNKTINFKQTISKLFELMVSFCSVLCRENIIE